MDNQKKCKKSINRTQKVIRDAIKDNLSKVDSFMVHDNVKIGFKLVDSGLEIPSRIMSIKNHKTDFLIKPFGLNLAPITEDEIENIHDLHIIFTTIEKQKEVKL